MNRKDIVSKIEELNRKKLSAETQMKFLSADLERVNKELDELESQAWFLGDDARRLAGVKVSCSCHSWQEAKNEPDERPFFVEEGDDNYIEFSLEDAKELIKYMQEKIDYLESED